MKAKDLRERTTDHLQEMEKQLAGDAFQARFKNFTNRLNDTASINRARRDMARVKTILAERANAEATGASAAASKDATTAEKAD